MRFTSALLVLLCGAVSAAEPVDWLPDMIVDRAFLMDYAVSTSIVPGRTHLLLSNATPNIGLGDMYVYGLLPANEDGSQDVMQRVFRSDGSYYDLPAGRFIHHPEHDHIHLEDWAEYRLREITENGGVGEIVAGGEKTSFCLRDSRAYDPTLTNFRPGAKYDSCEGLVQGISVGFEDIYSKDLPDQWIDITDLPAGEYWLESVVDPENHVVEADETNNVERVKVTIGDGAGGTFRSRLVYFFINLRLMLLWLKYLRG
ncbi:MAG: lysyl oxidase family protein [FCB group bacterium]|nr:lysyl oxidase family protein [FCB group bacterium]